MARAIEHSTDFNTLRRVSGISGGKVDCEREKAAAMGALGAKDAEGFGFRWELKRSCKKRNRVAIFKV